VSGYLPRLAGHQGDIVVFPENREYLVSAFFVNDRKVNLKCRCWTDYGREREPPLSFWRRVDADTSHNLPQWFNIVRSS